MHHYMEKMTRHIKAFGVSDRICQSFYVNMGSLRSSANQLKYSLCLFTIALCIKLAIKL